MESWIKMDISELTVLLTFLKVHAFSHTCILPLGLSSYVSSSFVC